ncbi:unnamed protein product [Adineta ricciae]|uniref:Uncharacterized protein n=1 Tax=Adineta ricciae TaxID=249248 RepID=A0A815F6I8_ADIRI|nr:unnamed protein product [Adineta ricciae]CAF1397353.1 unnamed protein product [Adineta ricciae]
MAIVDKLFSLKEITSSKLSKNNLETYSLLWLDSLVDCKENIDAQVKLRSSINHLAVFKETDQCEQHIQSLSQQDRAVLIVNNSLGQQLVPRIHQFRQIVSIFIYCKDQEEYQQWTKSFSKIKSIIVQLDELITQIQSGQIRRVQNKVDEPISINIFNMNIDYGQSTGKLNGEFVHSQLLIDSLLRMKSSATDKNDLVSLCRKEYYDNNTQLGIVQEFEENYSSDRSLWWYTKETFLYRLLNKALRVQNIDLLFLFRFFIRDIERELNQHRCLTSLLLYRGQLMSNKELQVLKDSIGQLISMNSFLSTSINRSLATFYLGESTVNDDLQKVLFEIDADCTRQGVKPFANISLLSTNDVGINLPN